jgi:hypothetical protein
MTASVMYWHETLGFLSEMGASSTNLLKTCVKYLEDFEVGRELIAVIVERATSISHQDIDEFVKKLLEKFRYGGTFDYELINVMKRLLSGRLTGLPLRIVTDVEYWHRKYSDFSPRVLRKEDYSDDVVLEYSKLSGHEHRLNAIWTIADRGLPDAESILSEIVLNAAEAPFIREQAVVSLGRLAAPSTLRVLVEIATNPKTPRRERAYALHALAHFPSLETLDALLKALLNPDDETISEDAAWAVSVIAENRPDLVEPYLDRLRKAFDTTNDHYTKGCIIFGLGRGKFEQCLEFVNQVLASEENPFVLDDACYFVESTKFYDKKTELALENIIEKFAHDSIVIKRAEKALETLKSR